MRNVAKVTVVALIVGVLQALPAAASPPQDAGPDMHRFVVVVEDGFEPRGLAREVAGATGGQVGFLYENAIKGFTISVPGAAVNGLANHPGVAFVEPDVKVAIAAESPSTGWDRIDADLNPGGEIYSGVDIAILDTGVWFDAATATSHEDLNLKYVTDCTGAILYPLFGGCTGGGNDGHGHGTHVAGIAGACDNDIGTLGTAPCATLWSFKVLGDDGTGFLGSIIAGVDLVAANSASIEVANMSLGFVGESQALMDAIDAAVAQGVVFVVAAGNDASNASTFMPAATPSAITVSAISDYDGAPGSLSAQTCYPGTDDAFAIYSNYGDVVDIAAPGTCIVSTGPNNGYLTFSGTSMAAPTVAGAAARYLADNGINPANGADVQGVRNALVNGGHPQHGPCGFTGDPDSSAEPLLFLNGSAFGGDETCGAGTPPPSDPPIAVIDSASCIDLVCDFDGSSSSDDAGPVTYHWDFADGGATATTVMASHTYSAGGSYTATLTVTDQDGQTDTASVNVNPIGPNVGPTAVIATPDCVDLGCAFDGSGSSDDDGVVSYSWDFGDEPPGTDSGSTTTYSYATAGTYTVTLTVADAEGLEDTATVDVIVTDPVTPPGDQFMTIGVAGFLYSSPWATVQFFVTDLEANTIPGAEVSGEWHFTDRRGRSKVKRVSGVADETGLVTIRTRFRTTPPDLFCVTDASADGYTYLEGPFTCGGLLE